jgi:hypothetical protein
MSKSSWFHGADGQRLACRGCRAEGLLHLPVGEQPMRRQRLDESNDAVFLLL